jgi:hypothetical protein
MLFYKYFPHFLSYANITFLSHQQSAYPSSRDSHSPLRHHPSHATILTLCTTSRCYSPSSYAQHMYPYISKLILNVLTKIILSTGYNYFLSISVNRQETSGSFCLVICLLVSLPNNVTASMQLHYFSTGYFHKDEAKHVCVTFKRRSADCFN